MIRKELVNGMYHYYDRDYFLLKIQKTTLFSDYILTKIDNEYVIMYKLKSNVWSGVFGSLTITNQPKIIFEFEKISLYINNNNKIMCINSNFECIFIGNNETELINYGLNQIRIEKLKTLL